MLISCYEDNIIVSEELSENDVENLSGKLDSFSLSDAIEASLNMQAPPEEQRSRGKRSSQTAALESGSKVVPREMPRMQSSLDTPDVSQKLSTPNDSLNLASFLNNCRQINDLQSVNDVENLSGKLDSFSQK